MRDSEYRSSPTQQDSLSPSQASDSSSHSSITPRDPRALRNEQSRGSPSGDPRSLRNEPARSSPTGDLRFSRKEESRHSPEVKKRHYTSSAKYIAANSSFANRNKSSLQQSSSKSKSSEKGPKGPQIVQPHLAASETAGKDKKKGGEKFKPVNFPGESTGLKKSLSSFKIPKRKPPEGAATKTATSPVAVKIPALDMVVEEKKDEKKEGKESLTKETTLSGKSDSKSTPSSASNESTKKEQVTTATVKSSVKQSISSATKSTTTTTTTAATATAATTTTTTTTSSSTAPPISKAPQAIRAPLPTILKPAQVSLASLLNITTMPSPLTVVVPPAAAKETKKPNVKSAKPAAKKAKEAPKTTPKAAERPKDLSSMLLSLEPSVLQTLAASIQQTLQQVSFFVLLGNCIYFVLC